MSLKDIDPADVEKIITGKECLTRGSCVHQVDAWLKGMTRENHSAREKGEDIVDFYIRAGILDKIDFHFFPLFPEEHQRKWRTDRLRRVLLTVVKSPVQFDPENIEMMDDEQLDALRRNLERISRSVEFCCKAFDPPSK